MKNDNLLLSTNFCVEDFANCLSINMNLYNIRLDDLVTPGAAGRGLDTDVACRQVDNQPPKEVVKPRWPSQVEHI